MPFNTLEELRAARDEALSKSDFLLLEDSPLVNNGLNLSSRELLLEFIRASFLRINFETPGMFCLPPAIKLTDYLLTELCAFLAIY